MRSEIDDAIRERAEFAKSDDSAILNTSRIIVLFGIDTFTEFRTTRSDQRAHIIDDAKKSHGPKSTQLLREVPGPPAPDKAGIKHRFG